MHGEPVGVQSCPLAASRPITPADLPYDPQEQGLPRVLSVIDALVTHPEGQPALRVHQALAAAQMR